MAQDEQTCLEEVCTRLEAVEAALKEAALEEVWSRLVAVEAALEEAALEEVWNRLVAAEAALKAAALKEVWNRLEAVEHASCSQNRQQETRASPTSPRSASCCSSRQQHQNEKYGKPIGSHPGSPSRSRPLCSKTC